jgi:hypothetical protein
VACTLNWRLQAEVTREKCEFEEAFKKWASRMEKHVLGKKLHSDWIPQMNLGSGESYYFNVRTGESSEEHPNMRQVRHPMFIDAAALLLSRAVA